MTRCIKCSKNAPHILKTVSYCDICFIENIKHKFLRSVKPILLSKSKILLSTKYSKLLIFFVENFIIERFRENFYSDKEREYDLLPLSLDEYTAEIFKSLFSREKYQLKKFFFPLKEISNYELDFAMKYFNIEIEEGKKDLIDIITDDFCKEINKWNYSAYYNVKKLFEKIEEEKK